MNHNDIWLSKAKLDKERHIKMREFLADYDSKVYDPAIKKVREDCKTLGHKYSFRKFNCDHSHEIYQCDYCGVSKHNE